jgi:hypothetical protein
MPEKLDPGTQKSLPPPRGPFVCAALSTAIGTALLIIMYHGLKLTLISVLSVVIPMITTATRLIAVSMGWIFVSIGRSKRQPRWVLGTAILIAITMLQLLVATYMTEAKQ